MFGYLMKLFIYIMELISGVTLNLTWTFQGGTHCVLPEGKAFDMSFIAQMLFPY